MLLNVPENPAPITVGIPDTFVPSGFTVSTNGIPANIARIITMIAKTNAIINATPVIKTPHFYFIVVRFAQTFVLCMTQ